MNKLISQLSDRPEFSIDNTEDDIQELFTNILNQLIEEQQVNDVCFDEVIRQVTIDCIERGEIIDSLRNRCIDQVQYLLKAVQYSFNRMKIAYDHSNEIDEKLIEANATIDKQQKELSYLGDLLKKVREERDNIHEELLTERYIIIIF